VLARYLPSLCVCPSVRQSVCLFVTRRCSTKTAKPRITQTTPYCSPGTLVFWCQKSRRNSNWATPNGATNRGGVGSNWRFSTNISLSQKRCKTGTLWKANRNSYSLYRMALFSVNLGDPNYPQTPFSKFGIPFHIFVVGGDGTSNLIRRLIV